ncbi:MAG: hypothetical protein HY557_04890 [Euryarchaeota archaeon]|nr:hypothetical protein [Euryarchaeota archaeon]
MRQRIVRSLVFPTDQLPESLLRLLSEFRLIVNRSIRIALKEDIRSRFRLSAAAYRTMSQEHDVYKQYIPSAFEVALAILKPYRRRVGRSEKAKVPYLRRLLLKAENQSYRLDRETGQIRIPIRRTTKVQLQLPLSEWHRRFLSDHSWRLGSLIVLPDRIIISVRKLAPEAYEPEAAIALDTNEASLDGVVVGNGTAVLVTVHLPEVPLVQATHFRRRRHLASKKAHDRRVRRRLLSREGCRERNRIRQRLHVASSQLVAVAENRRAAIVLEELRIPKGAGWNRRMRRRLSS